LRTFSGILAGLILVWSAFAQGQVVIEGGSSSERALIREAINAATPEQAIEAADSIFADLGYFDGIAVVMHDTLWIAFGEKYRIGKIILVHDINDTIPVDREFSREIMHEEMQALLDDYLNRGFYYAGVSPVDYVKRDGWVDIHCRLQPGPAMTISQVELTGLKRTSPEHLRKYIDLKTGDTIRDDAVEVSVARLSELDYVALASAPEIRPEPGYDRVRVVYYFQEQKSLFIEGSGGYVPEDDGYFMWYLNTRLRNIFGHGKYAAIFVDRREKNKAVFRAEYRQPVFFAGRGEAGLTLATRDYREQFYEFNAELHYKLELLKKSKIGLVLNWKIVEPDSGLGYSYVSYGVGLSFESGGIIARREIGFQSALNWKIVYNSREYDINQEDGDISRTVNNDTRVILKGEVSARFPGSLHWYGALNAHNIESGEKPLPVSELVLFGGPGSLRGYRNDQFAGRRVFIGSIEPRLFWDRESYLLAFLDAAYYEYYSPVSTGYVLKNDEAKFGYGFGFMLGGNERSLKISLAWGEASAIDEPRLNITLLNEF